MVTLEIKKREKEDSQKLGKERLIPAVFYGKKEKSTSISVKLNDFLKVWKEAGESSVVSLRGDGEEKEALVYEVQWDPVTGLPRHADFYVFEKGHKVEVKVPIEFVGVAPAVKELGGTLVKVLHELNIEAEPRDLPHEIKVEITPLTNFESRVLAKDLKLPPGVTLLEKPDEVVALVEEIKEEVVEEAPPPDLSQIEVEKKGKKDLPAQAGEEVEGEAQAPIQEGKKSSAPESKKSSEGKKSS
ncbi:MAG: large subunit ribosomal protein L25 [Parcubacteria group bacterium Gr01-1014_107]|nr:MAG: large subunit ribosomal protein L25 [Parcubacteria group bacterium Gr01-1014_107]